MSKWIMFRPRLKRTPAQRTEQWDVISLDGKLLGIVKWYGAWRQYAFFPEPETIYERQCLRDLAEFCEKETYKHREKHAAEQVMREEAWQQP